MRCGIPLLNDRVAPRCTTADAILIVHKDLHGACTHEIVSVEITNTMDLVSLLRKQRVEILVGGGVSQEMRRILSTAVTDVVDNVACTVDEIIAAICRGEVSPGFGLSARGSTSLESETVSHRPTVDRIEEMDCLACTNRVCLLGKSCPPQGPGEMGSTRSFTLRILEAAEDVSDKNERTLCRLAELVYFCLEMDYRKIGVAFCVELQEPTKILVSVLRRFFSVVPVCCKVGGLQPWGASDLLLDLAESDGHHDVACNPAGQARILNKIGTDLNVEVGLCIGADCVFGAESQAPVTTLFVKDRSLANNPIGALYSEYYLHDNLLSASSWDRSGKRSEASNEPSGQRPGWEEES